MASDFLNNYDACEDTLKRLYDSRLRLSILDALEKGPMRLADLRRIVDSNAPNTSAKAKELEDMGLLERIEGDYQLSDWGRLVHGKLDEKLRDLNKLLGFKAYWAAHDLSQVPYDLQKRLVELEGVRMLDYGFDVSKSEEDFCRMLQGIRGPKFYGLATIFSKIWVGIVVEKLKAGVDVKMILSEGVIRSTMEALGSKENIKLIDSAPNVEVFWVDHDPGVSFVSSSGFVSFRSAYKETGKQDLYKTIYGEDPKSIDWGFALFEHFKKRAKKVNFKEYL